MRDGRRAVCAASGIFAVLQIAVIAKWPIWWGGYCWGPRLLTEIVPGLIVLMAIGTPALHGRAPKTVLILAALYCVFIQALGVYCYPKGHWDHVPTSVNVRPDRLWDWRDNPIVRTARGGVVWEPYGVVATGLSKGVPAAAEKLKEYGINPY